MASYNANLPATARIADLSRVSPDRRCTVLLAGAPCQGFSTAGRRVVDDSRNQLLMRVAHIALETRPRVVVMENVPAALSGDHGRHWCSVEAALRNAGYNVRRLLLLGEESGVAQRRRRLFLLAWIGSDCIRVELDRVAAPTLRECLSGVTTAPDQLPVWLPEDGDDAVIARRILPGQKLCNVRAGDRAVPTWSIPEVFGPTSPEQRDILRAVSSLRRRDRKRSFGDGDPVEPATLESVIGFDPSAEVGSLVRSGYLRMVGSCIELRQTYNGKYRRLDWDGLSPTVDTHFGRASLFLHPSEHRGLTQREAARIQGFPDAYSLIVPQRDRFEVIGNAVPPPMAARVARFVREALLKA